MKVEIKELPKHAKEMIFEVEKPAIDEERKHILQEVRNTAEIPGFRKGKIPEKIIEARFKDAIKEKLLEHLITHSYMDAVQEHKLVPIIEPEVSDVKFEDNLSFKVYIEVRPDIVVKKYKDLPVRKVEPEKVTEEKIDGVLAEWEKKKEFASSIIDPDKRRAWREKIRNQMEQMNTRKARHDEEDQLWKQLFENSKLEIPEKLLLQRARRLTQEQFSYVDTQGKSEEEQKKIAEELFEKMKPVAEIQMRKFFILSKVAELEKIEVTETEAQEHIGRLSRTSGEEVAQVRKRLEESGRMEDLKDELRMDKTFDFLMSTSQQIRKIVIPGEEK